MMALHAIGVTACAYACTHSYASTDNSAMSNSVQEKLGSVFLVTLFIACSIFSTLIPPFQSPDEFEHVKRAYLFGKGEIVLTAAEGQSSGGMIDNGLLCYMHAFDGIPFHPENKVTSDVLHDADLIKWEHANAFSPALGQAYYFPAIYSIHALGLILGEHLDFTINASYRLTKLLLLIATCGVLFLAFRLCPPTPLIYALLVIPMSLFQFSSASLDGIATALSLLIVSAFLRTLQIGKFAPAWLFYLMIIAWMLVASSRVHLFSLILMALAVYVYTRRTQYLIATFLAIGFVVLWQVIVMKTIVDGRVDLHATSSAIIATYVQNPARFLSVVMATVTTRSIAAGYFSSFFGMLGWLDAPFHGKEYIYLGILTLTVGAFSVDWKNLGKCLPTRLLLVLCSLVSVFTIFFALLVTWTPHPATIIDGVQGRYFLVPSVLLAYATSGLAKGIGSTQEKIGMIALVILAVFSSVSMTDLLVERYYLYTPGP